ncbi:E3 ubiquitin-protein ligase PDZRN3-B-like [Liolophura sinensis]|uniref:E3 ubiquitin-protein ligase PDZRN3-B-like n=1 Tax=Liolophura sinensis TaxID=3198878 RepID=UPI003158E81A
MGFDVDRFANRVTDDKKCSLCQGVLEHPVRTTCCHVFCWDCIFPWVKRHGKCPKNCRALKTADLDQFVLLPLKREISKMFVRCDFVDRGCEAVVRLSDLACHTQSCPKRPVQCRNAGCGFTIDRADLQTHERKECDFRPVGACIKGCELVLLKKSATNHDCMKALRKLVREQEVKIETMEADMATLISKYHRREKILLSQIVELKIQNRLQSLKFSYEAVKINGSLICRCLHSQMSNIN